tara:strand:+ start:1102 stop:1227 length:126 start_codon:yes stop_codon:yes gene_type:complete
MPKKAYKPTQPGKKSQGTAKPKSKSKAGLAGLTGKKLRKSK